MRRRKRMKVCREENDGRERYIIEERIDEYLTSKEKNCEADRKMRDGGRKLTQVNENRKGDKMMEEEEGI